MLENAVDPISGELARIRAEYARRDRETVHSEINHYYFSHVAQTVVDYLCKSGRFPLTGYSVLDVGCGDGSWLLKLREWGASRLSGVELRPERLSQAAERLPEADLVNDSAHRLPWPDSSFNLVSQFTVFSSVLHPELRRAIAREMLRVLKPSGLMIWFDFRVNNPRNPNVRGIRKNEITALFPHCDVDLQSVLLAPPLVRRILPHSLRACSVLEKLPFLRTHYFGIIRSRNSVA